MKTIGVTGLWPKTKSVGPSGIHLRWMFPPEVGFPHKGVFIHRLPTAKIPWECQSAAKPLVAGAVSSGKSVGPYTLYYADSAAKLSAVGPSGSRILEIPNKLTGHKLALVFSSSVLRCKITFIGPRDDLEVRAYSGTVEVDCHLNIASSSNATKRVLEVSGGAITSVVVSLNARFIEEVCIAHAKLDWGRALVHLKAPPSVSAALKRLEPGLFNRYSKSTDDAVARYKVPAGEIVSALKKLLAPDDTFEDPNVSPEKLLIPSDSDHPISGYRPQQMLLAAALDPNIARLIGLLWVDRASGNNGPEPGQSYSYMVSGTWKQGFTLNGYAVDIGSQEGPMPDFGSTDPPEGNVVPGRRWLGREPLSRVALRWNSPLPVMKDKASTAVAFDLYRHNGNKKSWLTEENVVLVPSQIYKNKSACYLDDEVRLGKVQYDVIPIDLFGQVGESVSSASILVTDIEAPPPPVRTYTKIRQPGMPWLTAEQRAQNTGIAELGVAFEYGAAQFQQAPDAETVRLYWRADSSTDEIEATSVVVSKSAVDDQSSRWTLKISANSQLDTAQFVGGVVRFGVEAPISQRRAFAILAAPSPDFIVITGPASTELAGGSCLMRSDGHRRDLWHLISENIKLPAGIQLAIETNFDVNSRTLDTTISNTSTAPMPRPQPIPTYVGNTEAFADQTEERHVYQIPLTLIEAGDLDGAVLQIGGEQRMVLGSSAGAMCQIELDGSVAVGINTTVQLKFPSDSNVHIIEIKDGIDSLGMQQHEPGGELAFDVADTLIVARVIGHSRATSNSVPDLLLVRFLGNQIPNTPATAVFHARHHIAVDVAVTPGVQGDISLPTLDGTRMGFVALTAVDLRGNEGPLSAAVPFAVVQAPPDSIPQQPFPCGELTAAAGYSEPVSANGMSTFCLQWISESELRYEVARALDTTIIATDRRGWRDANRAAGLGSWDIQITSIEPLDTGDIVARFSLPADVDWSSLPRPAISQSDKLYKLNHIDTDRYRIQGEHELTVGDAALHAVPILPARQLDVSVLVENSKVIVTPILLEKIPTLVGGRLDVNQHRYQITAAVTASGNQRATVVLRAITDGAPSTPSGTGKLYQPPNHSQIEGDVKVLRALAMKRGNEDSFTLVSGVSVKGDRFRDVLPGRGSNRFFYRIRGVDAANNRTGWSAPSVPINLADTTPPTAATEITAQPGERQVKLRWRHDANGWNMSYVITRTRGEEQIEVGVVDVQTGGSTGTDYHVFVDNTAEGLRPGEKYHYQVNAIKHVPIASDRTVSVSTLSEAIATRSFDTSPPPIPQDMSLVQTNEGVLITWTTDSPQQWLIKRVRLGESFGKVLESNGLAEAGMLQGGRHTYTFLDDEFNSLKNTASGIRYELTVKNHLGRTSGIASAIIGGAG